MGAENLVAYRNWDEDKVVERIGMCYDQKNVVVVAARIDFEMKPTPSRPSTQTLL